MTQHDVFHAAIRLLQTAVIEYEVIHKCLFCNRMSNIKIFLFLFRSSCTEWTQADRI